MSKSPKRKQFERMKRKKGFYNQFNGKDTTKEIHHRRMLSKGGENKNYNFVYLIAFWHKLYHRLYDRGETNMVNFRGKNPSLAKQVEDISDGCIEKIKENQK